MAGQDLQPTCIAVCHRASSFSIAMAIDVGLQAASRQLEPCPALDGVQQLLSQRGGAPEVGQLRRVRAGSEEKISGRAGWRLTSQAADRRQHASLTARHTQVVVCCSHALALRVLEQVEAVGSRSTSLPPTAASSEAPQSTCKEPAWVAAWRQLVGMPGARISHRS